MRSDLADTLGGWLLFCNAVVLLTAVILPVGHNPALDADHRERQEASGRYDYE